MIHLKLCSAGSILVACVASLCVFQSVHAGAKPPPPIPDLTKPNAWQPSSPKEADYYNLGPTGMMGIFKGPNRSDMIFVDSVSPNSPAFGKLKRGDVLLGVAGRKFVKGDNLIVLVGNAINEAEKEENGGKLTFTVWRDENWAQRAGINEIDVTTITVDDIRAMVESEQDGFSEWRTEEQQAAHAKAEKADDLKKAYEKYPMVATVKEITITLEVLGTFSATAPFNCPKTNKIIEKAYPHIIQAAKGRNGLKGWRSGTTGLALLATGNPEHTELVTQLLHKNESLMEGAPVGKGGWRWHYGAWFGGYYLTFLGEYYLRTGDKAILPGLRQWALAVARIQAYGGTWGHSGHSRRENFGKLHGPATGYGAMNQAAGPCFYGLTLAQKAGINEPDVDEAIRRSVKFYATYVDKGTVPYGYHPPAMYEDSNGKNGPPTLAMKMVGEYYNAKYFSLSCAVGSSWGYRGGHGNGTFGNYWPQLASSVSGKDAVAAWMAKMHPYYTMLRRHDGSWVTINSGSSGGIGGLFNPTAMYMLHYNIPKAKLYMTGRDPVPDTQATERDIMHLKDRMYGNWRTFTTDQILERMDTFSTELRRSTTKGYPSVLIERYKAGKTTMVPKLVKMLDHENHRAREAAFYMISNLGKEEALKILPRAVKGLEDPSEIVRMAAVATIRTATSEVVPGVTGRRGKPVYRNVLTPVIDPLFAAALRKFENDTHDTYNTPHFLQKLMINSDNAFAKAPFDQGYDTEKVALVLEEFLSQDPRQSIMDGPEKYWDRKTTVRMAGPIAFVAENYPLNGIMFGGSATSGAQGLLMKHKFLEGVECAVMECNKISRVRRAWRPRLGPTKLGWFPAQTIMKNKGLGKNAVPWMLQILVERPNTKQEYSVGRDKKASLRLDDAIKMIDNHPQPEGWKSLQGISMKAFLAEVDAQGGKEAQIAYCRAALRPERKTYFRQMAAMDRLVELLGEEATKDLAPYLSHDHWRFQDHSRALVLKFKGNNVSNTLVSLTASDQKDVVTGALTMLGARGDKEGLKAGLKYVTDHPSGLVRGAAAQAIYGGSDGSAVDKVLGFIRNAKDPLELEGYETALLLRRADPDKAKATAEAIRKAVPDCSVPVRRSLYYVLGQIGGKENLDYLASHVDTKDETEFADVIEAISWSSDISATELLSKILTDHQGTHRAMTVSDLSLKRVINGAKELGKVPDDVNLDFAAAHLKVVRNLQLIEYLGGIHSARCMSLLYRYMKLGPERVTSASVKSIIRSAEGIPKSAPVKERKQVSEILAEVLEFINVVHTRKDIETVSFQEAGAYAEWKLQADKAGVIIKRIYNPREEALDINTGINEDDLDL